MIKTNCSFPAIAYILLLCHLIAYSLWFVYALYRIDYSLIPHSFAYHLCALTLPILLWFLSTISKEFNYHRFKLTAYIAPLYCEALIIISIVFQLLSRLFLPFILAIKTYEIFTKGMVIFLARLVTEFPLLPLFYLLMKSFLRPIRDAKSRNVILCFKLTHYLHTGSKKRSIQYPLSIARDIRSGKNITISETDCFLHTLVDGTSGTGKTSSTILPAIRDDLNMLCQAEQEQIKAMHKLVQDGLYAYTGSFSHFSLSDFLLVKGVMPDKSSETKTRARVIPESLRMQYPVCGITVLTPEDSLTDDVCRLSADLQLLINNFDLLPPYVSKLDELDREKKRYSFISQYIREDLLGKGRPKMEDQNRGTRNIINEFLLMSGSKEVYCTQVSIDFDQILENGEITVCNYDLASGDSNAIAFGLFFLLSFNNAVLSRPGTEKTRIPHFFMLTNFLY